MQKNFNTKKNRTILSVIAVMLVLIFIIALVCILKNVESCECYIGNYDEYICYEGEIYYRICDENKDMFTEEFLDSYEDYLVVTPDDFDRADSVRGLNTGMMFLTENVEIVYNNSNHDEIVYLTLAQGLETIKEYAKPDK